MFKKLIPLLIALMLVCMTQMMKEWAAARQRVQELKDVDPKGADKLNQEITAVSTLSPALFHLD